MGRRHQSVLPLDEVDEDAVLVAPSVFLPGRVPARYQPDPRGTPKWRRVRKEALARDQAICRHCGQPATEVDHRVELIDGGAPFDLDNLQSLCAACHDSKSSEARYRRAARASSTWGRMTACPGCAGSGRCLRCESALHVCNQCLGVRVVPERCMENRELPSQLLLAEVSPLAWAGAEPRPPGP
jgi:HNH endonuclease